MGSTRRTFFAAGAAAAVTAALPRVFAQQAGKPGAYVAGEKALYQ